MAGGLLMSEPVDTARVVELLATEAPGADVVLNEELGDAVAIVGENAMREPFPIRLTAVYFDDLQHGTAYLSIAQAEQVLSNLGAAITAAKAAREPAKKKSTRRKPKPKVTDKRAASA
jgi:hypothetical protein